MRTIVLGAGTPTDNAPEVGSTGDDEPNGVTVIGEVVSVNPYALWTWRPVASRNALSAVGEMAAPPEYTEVNDAKWSLVKPGALSSALKAVMAPIVNVGRCSSRASSTTCGSNR